MVRAGFPEDINVSSNLKDELKLTKWMGHEEKGAFQLEGIVC